MAIIVDKVQKKKDIACACKDLFIKKGLSNITIAEVAQTAGVGKGTIYEYFKNKEEILFEIANILLQRNEEELKVEIANSTCTKDKIKKFSEFFYSEEDFELRKIYKEFISISLVNPNEEMIAFQTQANNHFYELFKEIIEEGVRKNELIEESLDLSLGIYSTGKGLFLMSSITNFIDDLKKELDLYIDTIFKLMEVKK
jgi:AcrR family transcriptional regulator